MSWNRENIVWQSKDKTWSIGFYSSSTYGNYDDPDYDPEWDVEYDYNSFEFVSTGHRTEQEARAAWHGANPGGPSLLPYSTAQAKGIAELDRMALWHKNPALAEAAAKKEAAKLKREHVKKLKQQFDENDNYKGCRVSVTVKLDDASYTYMGASRTYTGYATTVGDWLMVENVKVKNLKTGRFNSKLHAIKAAPSDSWGRGYGYGRGY